MKDELRAKLEAVFARHEAASAQQKLNRQERHSSEIDALQDFHDLCRSVIKPTMQEFVDLLASRGIAADITTTAEDLTEENPVSTASISLRVLINPKHTKRAFDVPGITVFCDKRHRKLRFHQSTLGRGSPGLQSARDLGEAGFDQLSPDRLQEMLTDFIAALYT